MTTANAVKSNFNNFFTEGSIEYIYEDDQCVAFDANKNQQAPTHFLVVPKKVIPRLSQAAPEDEKLLGHLLIVCRRVAKTKGLHPTGFRVIMNEGPQGGPTVDHLHLHVMGHRQMMWPFC
ncbi:hypothetical protein ABMA28_011149 [Loxostege sticticalis]|uniref:HIT domain-containing protein n=1 Tax=Loxostege sticticalis TaxID=481309 RepID=A0ABD0S6C6_LOXSC